MCGGQRSAIALVALLAILFQFLAACGTPENGRGMGRSPGARGGVTATRGTAMREVKGTPTVAKRTPPTASRVAPPSLALEPDHGPCNNRITVRGKDFPPGKDAYITGRATVTPTRRLPNDAIYISRAKVDDDGRFSVDYNPSWPSPYGCP